MPTKLSFIMVTRVASIFIFSFLLTSVVQAQDTPTDQGTYVLDGSASFRSQGGDLYGADDDRQTTVSFQPAGLYLIAPNLAVIVRQCYPDDSWYWSLGNVLSWRAGCAGPLLRRCQSIGSSTQLHS